MAIMRPFRAVRPRPEYAERVAAPPYDVMGSGEAREMAEGNPYSFLRVDKAEIDLPPGTDPYCDAVYQKARENLDKLVSDGILAQDEGPCFYIYRLTMDGRAQTGLVGCASVDDYLSGVIRKHEHTRADKEADRIRHVDTLDANTGPIFLTCRPERPLSAAIGGWTAAHPPVYDFTAKDGVGHTAWIVDDAAVIGRIGAIFAGIGALYIADGHHRCASAVRVGQRRREANPGYTGGEEFNFFLSVVFPSDQLRILDYNRVVRDLNGNTEEEFLEQLRAGFTVEASAGPVRPGRKHEFGLRLGGGWYRLTAKPGSFDEGDPVARLDVSILQNRVLAPILGIGDPRTDHRIDFVGGIRGLGELEARVASGMACAFSVYPATLDDLMAIADAGMVMPPKSTWFEPKLRSGLFLHRLSESERNFSFEY